MNGVQEIELAVELFATNQDFIRLYTRYTRELLLQHFLLIAAAGDEVWRFNQEHKIPMQEQRELMLLKYVEWLDKRRTEFPEVEKPFDVSEEWWRLMLLAYERKPVSGKSLHRKFKEDTRNPILISYNVHWREPQGEETLEDRFRVVRRGVWADMGHKPEEFVEGGSWLPKQWYAWRYCCYPGKRLTAFDGRLPTMAHLHNHPASGGSNRLSLSSLASNIHDLGSSSVDSTVGDHVGAAHSGVLTDHHQQQLLMHMQQQYHRGVHGNNSSSSSNSGIAAGAGTHPGFPGTAFRALSTDGNGNGNGTNSVRSNSPAGLVGSGGGGLDSPSHMAISSSSSTDAAAFPSSQQYSSVQQQNARLLQTAASLTKARNSIMEQHQQATNTANLQRQLAAAGVAVIGSSPVAPRASDEAHLASAAAYTHLAEVQGYVAERERLERAIALAAEFGDTEKMAGFKRKLYEHVQTECPYKR